MDQPVSPEQPANADDPAQGRMTRTQVANCLGFSVSKVRTMEGKVLHPTKVNGVNYFDPKEVEAFSKNRGKRATSTMTEGQIAAAVFNMIDHGKELREIVIELEQPPALIRELYREWMDDFSGGEARRQETEREAKEEREKEAAQRRGQAEMRDFDRIMAKAMERYR